MSHHDLLHTYLSGNGSPDDEDTLGIALASDPALAREFAEAARVEAHITAHFRPTRPALPLVAELQTGTQSSPARSGATKGKQSLVPPAKRAPSSRPHRHWPRAAAAILVALGLVVATIGWLARQHGVPSSGSDDAPTPRRGPSPSDGEIGAFPRPPSTAKQHETPEMAALRRRLEKYYLTDVGLEQAMPLSQALQRVLSRARELNHLHRPIIDTLNLAQPEGKAAVAASQIFVRLPQKSLTLMDALRLLAIQAGGDVLLNSPGTIRFQPLPELDSRKLVTRILRVRPDFFSSEPDPAKATDAQIATEIELQTRKEMRDPSTIAARFDISLPEHTAIAFDAATSSLTVTHTEATLRRIEAFLAVDSRQVSTMVDATTKLFEFAQGHQLENRLMDSAGFQVWLREQSGIKGVDLLTTPQVTTRTGQNVMVQVLRERATVQEMDWQGVRIELLPTLEGEVIHLTGSAEVRRPRDLPPGQLLENASTPSNAELVSTAVDIEALIPPGQTALFSLSESADGPHLLGAITINLINPSGQRLGGEGDEKSE